MSGPGGFHDHLRFSTSDHWVRRPHTYYLVGRSHRARAGSDPHASRSFGSRRRGPTTLLLTCNVGLAWPATGRTGPPTRKEASCPSQPGPYVRALRLARLSAPTHKSGTRPTVLRHL